MLLELLAVSSLLSGGKVKTRLNWYYETIKTSSNSPVYVEQQTGLLQKFFFEFLKLILQQINGLVLHIL